MAKLTCHLGKLGWHACLMLSEVIKHDQDQKTHMLTIQVLSQFGNLAIPSLFDIERQGIGTQSAGVSTLNIVLILMEQIKENDK